MSGNNPDTLKVYYLAHKDEILAYKRAWQATNKAAIAAKKHAYHLAHKEEIAAKGKAHYAAHKEAINARNRAYQAKHRAALRAQKRAYLRAHPEIEAANRHRYRAKKRHAPRNDLTASQWLEIQAAQDHRCYYCGTRCKGRLTQDHILPLSQGGSHTLHNVIGACHSCNCRKQDGPPLTPVQPLLLTIAPARKKTRT